MTTPKMTLRFAGHLKAMQPLATSPPHVTPDLYNQPDLKKIGKHGASPLPRLRVTVEGEKGNTSLLRPYFPAGGIRGKLRRMAVALLHELRPGTMTVQTYHFNAIGGVKGSVDANDASATKTDLETALRRREQNKIASLFGSGEPWMASKLCVTHAIPKDHHTAVVRGARVDDFIRTPETLGVLSPAERERWQEQTRIISERARVTKLIEDHTTDATKSDSGKTKRLEELRQELAALPKPENDVSTNTTIAGYEVMPQGAELEQEFILRDVDPLEAGLFLLALQRLSFDPFIGAHIAHGCGMISGEWQMTKIVAGAKSEGVTLKMVAFSGLEGLTPEMQGWMNAFTKAAAPVGPLNFDAPTASKAANDAGVDAEEAVAEPTVKAKRGRPAKAG